MQSQRTQLPIVLDSPSPRRCEADVRAESPLCESPDRRTGGPVPQLFPRPERPLQMPHGPKNHKKPHFLFPGNKIIFPDRLQLWCMHTNCPCAVSRKFGAPVSDPARFSTATNAPLTRHSPPVTRLSTSRSVWSTVASAPLLRHSPTKQSSSNTHHLAAPTCRVAAQRRRKRSIGGKEIKQDP